MDGSTVPREANGLKKDTPFDTMPIFVKAGAILPMMDAKESIPDAIRFNPLYFHVWPGIDAEFDYYEDDGISAFVFG